METTLLLHDLILNGISVLVLLLVKIATLPYIWEKNFVLYFCNALLLFNFAEEVILSHLHVPLSLGC